MKLFHYTLLFLLISFSLSAQQDNRPKQPDLPGDISVDFGFNFFNNNPEWMDLRFFPSRNFSVYYQYGFRISDRFRFVPSLGVANEKFGFKEDLNFQKQADESFVFDTLENYIPRRNKLAVNYVELPLELRFYPNKTQNGEGLFVSVGVLAGWKIESHTKIKYEWQGNRRAEKQRADFGLRDYRAAATFRVGWKAISLYGKYYLTTPFDNGPFATDPSLFTIGLTFSGF